MEIGWRLAKAYWNKGYATEGAKACLQYGYDKLGFQDVYSFTSQLNKPSIRVMEKIGLIKIGEFMHIKLEDENPLKPHVLYHKTK